MCHRCPRTQVAGVCGVCAPGIENSLYHVPAVTFCKDAGKIRRGNASENLSVIRKIALTPDTATGSR